MSFAIVLDKENSPYVFTADFNVPSTDTLFIKEGVTLLFGEGVNLNLYCNTYIYGTKDEPVEMKPINENGSWGRINIWTVSEKQFVMENALVESGIFHSINTHVKMLNVTFFNKRELIWNEAIARIIGGSAEIIDCTIYGNKQGEGLLIHESENAVIQGCYFEKVPDAIEFISMKNCLIRKNVFFDIADDAIDLNHSENILVDSNYISVVQDRGFEIGAEKFGKSKNIQLKRNVITGCDQGVTFKEGSIGFIENCTFFENRISVNCIEEIPGAGGSSVTILNSIFSSSLTQDIFEDMQSTVNISYSLSDTEWLNGDHNLYANPEFINPFLGNYNLEKGSPCVDSGNPNSPPDPDNTIADIGALYRDINIGLSQNNKPESNINIYPNPFIDEFFIAIDLEKKSKIKVKVYDFKGREVCNLLNENKVAGKIKLRFKTSQLKRWDGGNLLIRVFIDGSSKSFKLLHDRI